MSLARAFQVMTQALSELRAPVPHEALRLRMVAMHGREDPLLDPTRFARLLRQANDAEVADVRKVGEDEYEVSPHRSSLVPPIAAAGAAPAAQSSPAPEEAQAGVEATAGDTDSRENGQRRGLRFRRGSRGPMRAADIPLIGVVEIEPPMAPEPVGVAVAEPEAAAEAPAPKKRARPRAPRKKAAAQAPAAEAAAGEGSAATAPPPKRTRSRPRAKKKTE